MNYTDFAFLLKKARKNINLNIMADWLSFGGGIVDTGLGLLRDHFNRKWQEEINAQNWEQEQLAASQAYQRQLSIMDRYQTPMAQRRMLEQAGLNVGMMYAKGGGGMSGGGASVAKAQGASAQAPQMQANLGIARQVAEIKNIQADTAQKEQDAKRGEQDIKESETYIEKMQAEIELLKEQTDTEVERRESIKLENAWQIIQNEMAAFDANKQEQRFEWEEKLKNNEISLQEYTMNVLKAQEEQFQQLAKKYEAETEGIKKQNKWIDRLNQKQLDEADSRIALNNAEALLLGIEHEIAKNTKQDRIDILKKTKEQMEVQLDLMKFANDNKEFMYHYQNFLQGVGAVVDVGNMISNFVPTRHIINAVTKSTTNSKSEVTTVGADGKPITTTTKSTSKSGSNTTKTSKKGKTIINK